MNYLRKLKIYHLNKIKSKNLKFNQFIEFTEEIFKELRKYKIIDKGIYVNNYIYKNNKNEIIFYYDIKNKNLWISEIILFNIENNFTNNHDEVDNIMKYLIFYNFKLSKLNIRYNNQYNNFLIFKDLKFKLEI